MSKDELLVIGAGPVGLAMAKALQEQGLAYRQVDARDGVGGNWRHGVSQNTHIVSSKRATSFADYPMPSNYPDFPSAAQMLRYLENYARHHGLLDEMELGRKVVSAAPLADGAWSVRFADGETRTYKGVVVCNGHHWNKRMPSVPGIFSGRIIHSQDFRDPSDFAGQRVLVIGGGNSGCDMVSEAARVGACSHWSLRSGYWFLPKTAFGIPLMDLPIWSLPIFMQRLILRGIVWLVIGDYRSYGLKPPSHKLFERHPTSGSEALGFIRQGRVCPRPGIARADGSTVHFTDGTSDEYDLIVAATGFDNSFPFLPDGMVEVKNGAAQIYGGAFPAGVRNLYIIGSSQPRTGFGSLATPAAALHARMIALQDELEQPIGDILKWSGETLPTDNFVDPGRAHREIWMAHRMLWLLKLNSRRMAREAPAPTVAVVHRAAAIEASADSVTTALPAAARIQAAAE